MCKIQEGTGKHTLLLYEHSSIAWLAVPLSPHHSIFQKLEGQVIRFAKGSSFIRPLTRAISGSNELAGLRKPSRVTFILALAASFAYRLYSASLIGGAIV